MKNKLVTNILFIIVAVIILSILLVATLSWSVFPRQYVTTDVKDYGNYIGNYDNKSVRNFVTSFFPEEINSSFDDVKYSYRAQKNDTYAFEAYLEFTIEDANEYKNFISQYTSGIKPDVFRYDSSYMEYIVEDKFTPIVSNEYSDIHISYAKIGKILCSKKEQRIIFVALGVYDGGIATTDFLCSYFNRFQIDPLEYAEWTIENG